MPKKLVRVSVVVEVEKAAGDPSAEVCRIIGDHIPELEGITVKSCIGGLLCTADTFRSWESHVTFGTPLDNDTVACVVAGGLAEEADFELRSGGFYHAPTWPNQ